MPEEQLVKELEVRDFQSGVGQDDIPQFLQEVSEDDHRLTLRTAKVTLIHPKLAGKFIGLLFPLFEAVFMVSQTFISIVTNRTSWTAFTLADLLQRIL